MTFYKCVRVGHYSKDCMFKGKICYECGDREPISKTCSNKNETASPNVPPKRNARALHIILDQADDATEEQEYGAACPKYKI